MEIAFTKMQGAGNDFVMIENLDGRVEISREQIAWLCDRRFGIGGDGLILLDPPKRDGQDATMVYYNADGGRVDMCGNGARCFTSFALQNGLGSNGKVAFQTDAGAMTATEREGVFTIRMTPAHDLKLDQQLATPNGERPYHFLNTGVEHVVVFVDDVAAVDIVPEGSFIRYHEAFAPKGTNANFAEVLSDGSIMVRTYERGVEGETLACGTGVVAVAIAAHLTKGVPTPVATRVAGGDTLVVDFIREGDRISDVTLTGPAKVSFKGTVEV